MTAGLETVYSSLSFAQFGGMGNCASGLAANAFYFPMHFTSDFLFFVLLSPPISGDFSYKSPKNGKPAIKNQSFHFNRVTA